MYNECLRRLASGPDALITKMILSVHRRISCCVYIRDRLETLPVPLPSTLSEWLSAWQTWDQFDEDGDVATIVGTPRTVEPPDRDLFASGSECGSLSSTDDKWSGSKSEDEWPLSIWSLSGRHDKLDENVSDPVCFPDTLDAYEGMGLEKEGRPDSPPRLEGKRKWVLDDALKADRQDSRSPKLQKITIGRHRREGDI